MRRIAVFVGSVAAVLLLAISGPTYEQRLSPSPAEAGTPALKVTVACRSTPEATRVKNNRSRPIMITGVGSIHQPRNNEPFVLNRRLGARKSMVFESGRGANRNVLTRQFIYDNDVGRREGARITTGSGQRFVDRCG